MVVHGKRGSSASGSSDTANKASGMSYCSYWNPPAPPALERTTFSYTLKCHIEALHTIWKKSLRLWKVAKFTGATAVCFLLVVTTRHISAAVNKNKHKPLNSSCHKRILNCCSHDLDMVSFVIPWRSLIWINLDRSSKFLRKTCQTWSSIILNPSCWWLLTTTGAPSLYSGTAWMPPLVSATSACVTTAQLIQI